MKNICRTCMSKDVEMISIFDESKSPPIYTMIMAISSLEFLPSDALPSQICVTCFETLQMTYYFKEQVISCNDELQKQAQCSKLLLPKSEEDENMVEDECFSEEKYGIHFDGITSAFTENIAIRVGDPPIECPDPLISVGTFDGDPLSETATETLKMKLSLGEGLDDVHLEENSCNTKDVDCHLERCIKIEEVEVEEHDVQLQDNLETTQQQSIFKQEVDDDGFSSEDDLPLTMVYVNSGSYHESQDVLLLNSNEYDEGTREASEGSSHLKLRTKTGRTTKMNPHTDNGIPKSRRVCELCGKSFPKAYKLKLHMRIHTGERPYKCQQCDAKFTCGGNLKEHTIRVHSVGDVPKPHKCEVCGKLHRSRSGLKSHMIRHTGEKSFKCQYCGELFSYDSYLKRHIRLHTGEVAPRPHKCEVCGQAFEAPSRVKKHMKIHARERFFKKLQSEVFADTLKEHCLNTGEGGNHLES